MHRNAQLITLFMLLAFVKCLSTTARAESSLYDIRSSSILGKNITTYYFGPRSGNIRYDQRMVHAAEIAAARARAHSTSRCWHAVKNALVDAHLVDSRPTSEYAKQAGDELNTKYGFRKTSIKNPFAAPVGSVLVYGGRGAGHVEIRTANGFVSDFTSPTPSPRPLLGIYVKSS